MYEFLKAAFPWIIMGVAVALFAVYHVQSKKRAAGEDGEQSKPKEDFLQEGMCIGMCLGVMLGSTGVCDLATGISLGMLFGEVVGMFIKK